MNTANDYPMTGRTVADRYIIGDRIASGGMATVYLAEDLRLERSVAIKVMHSHLIDDPKFVNKFISEARSAARLSNPNVVNVFDQGHDPGFVYMVMEYVPGITLRQLLRTRHYLTTEQTLEILIPVLKGLASAHKAGLVHRDIKPENILLSDSGQIKLSDFGLSRGASNNTTTGQGLLGTIAYLSPELITRSEADARSDIYAMGIMTFEMLTGRQPFTGDQPMQVAHKHATIPMPLPSRQNPNIPVEIDSLVLWMTAKDPDKRPANAQILLEEMRELDTYLRAGRTGNYTAAYQPTVQTEVLSSQHYEQTQTLQLDKKSSRRSAVARFLVISALVTVFLFGIVGASTWYFLMGPGAMVRVADFSSLTPEQLKEQLEKSGLKVTIEKRHDRNVPAGQLINPPVPGTFISRDTPLTLNLSLGPLKIDIPRLEGLSTLDAINFFREKNLRIYKSEDYFWPDSSAGVVIKARTRSGKDVTQGGIIYEGDEVEITSSLGSVPSVIGMSEEDARKELNRAGLGVAITQDFNDEYPEGQVFSQSSKADPIIKGSTIDLIISKGPDLVVVPRLTGKTLSEASNTLTDLGLQVNLVTSVSLDSRPRRIITDPAAGKQVRRGSRINLIALND